MDAHTMRMGPMPADKTQQLADTASGNISYPLDAGFRILIYLVFKAFQGPFCSSHLLCPTLRPHGL